MQSSRRDGYSKWSYLKGYFVPFGCLSTALLFLFFYTLPRATPKITPQVAGASIITLPSIQPDTPSPDDSNGSVKTTSSSTTKTTPKTDVKLVANPGLGLYVGPGRVTLLQNFSTWLGKPITHTTDYIDYKGGWQKDFIDSRVWLAEPWGKWVKATNNRKMVLGLPMLQNENYGQFSLGLTGEFDTYFRQLGENLVANGLGDSIIRLGYEANCDTIGPWQATDNPAGYKQLFRHQVAVLRAVPGSNFSFDWTVCNGLQTGKPLNSFESFYPGNDVVDIIGIDIYDVKWGSPNATPQQRWDYTVGRRMGVNELVAFAKQKSKPISYPEWGLYKPGDAFAGGGDNPYFIERMAELMNKTSPVYQAYFNLDWGGGILSDFPNGEATFRTIFGGQP